MFDILRNILVDKNTGRFTFELFSLCHIIYLIIICYVISILVFIYINRSKEDKEKLIHSTAKITLILYVLDFFLMPFSEGKIDIDKLPFHICTLMGVLCYISRINPKLKKYKTTFSILGLIGGLSYIVFPVGVASADGYSYRIIQTIVYHGLLVAQGIFSIAFKDLDLSFKNIKDDLIIILLIAVWAMLGNSLYSGTIKEACNCVENCSHQVTIYSHDFNWFFVKHDALYIINDNIDGYFSPFITVAFVFGLCQLIRFFCTRILKIKD